MKHEGDNYTNWDLCFWYSNKRIIKGTGGLGSCRTSGDHQNYSIIENDQNTEKSLGDSRRFAVTQTPAKKKPSANTDEKNSKGLNDNNNKILRKLLNSSIRSINGILINALILGQWT